MRRGAAVLMTAVVAGAAALGYQHTRFDGQVRVQMMTTQIGAGVVDGSDVRLDGVTIGRVDRIETADPGLVRLTLALRPDAVSELTTALSMDYAPANLFGISAIALHRGTGGTRLRDGIMVDLSGAGRVTDATMGRLLEQLAATTGQVLTPELTTTLRQASSVLSAVGPMLRAMTETTRAITDTQRYQPSLLIGQYAAGLRGLGVLLGGAIDLLYGIERIDILRSDRTLFDTSIDVITEDILTSAAGAGAAAQRALGPYAELMAPLLRALAATVPAPEQSAADVRELMNRLDGAFTTGPDGPVLNIAVVLHGVPAIAAPLLALTGPPGGVR